MPGVELKHDPRVSPARKLRAGILGAIIGSLLLMFLLLLGIGNPTGEEQEWDRWYLGFGPAVAQEMDYTGLPDIQPSEGADGSITQVSRPWTTASRTPEQACTDFKDGIIGTYVESGRSPLGSRIAVRREDQAQGGCRLTTADGLVTVSVMPRVNGGVLGADIMVTERRP